MSKKSQQPLLSFLKKEDAMKKIIVFTSDGAGGHTATTNALKASMGDTYNIQAVNIFKDVIGEVDIIYTLSGHRMNGEQFYEHCMVRKYNTFLSALHGVGKWYFRRVQKKLGKMVERFLVKHQPDLVISVIPLVDGAIVQATQKLGIPFLLLPTDLDSTNYIHDIYKPKHELLRVTLPFEDTDLRKKLIPAHIPTSQISVTGFPIRQDFFEHKDIKSIKQSFNVPENKPVILVLMGSVGSDALYSFTKELSKLPNEAHLIICTGRYEAIKQKINTISFPTHISTTMVGFTQRISDLMAIADLFITKAGPVSMSEAIYMNLPMLVDTTSSVLKWEKMNYQFIQKHEFGDVIKKAEDLPNMVSSILKDGKLQRMKDNLTAYDKKHGSNEVKSLIATMI